MFVFTLNVNSINSWQLMKYTWCINPISFEEMKHLKVWYTYHVWNKLMQTHIISIKYLNEDFTECPKRAHDAITTSLLRQNDVVLT